MQKTKVGKASYNKYGQKLKLHDIVQKGKLRRPIIIASNPPPPGGDHDKLSQLKQNRSWENVLLELLKWWIVFVTIDYVDWLVFLQLAIGCV